MSVSHLKIIHAHNFYLQSGGEDTTFAAEVALLRERGQHVTEYVESNERIAGMNKLNVAAQTLWSWDTTRKFASLLATEKPDIVHFHNTFPLISPSAYYACERAGIPVVQSLHNPRLICPAATLYRDGGLCQDCVGKTVPWPGIVHRCYHGSAAATAVIASMLTTHRAMGTWNSKVDVYIAFTDFYRQKFIEGGLPSEKITVKPHFVTDAGVRSADDGNRRALFIGRLDPEKGIRTMMSAWKNLRDVPLDIRGSGQLEDEVRRSIQENGLADTVQIVGRLSRQELTDKIKSSAFLVWPSEGFYETFGYVAVESFSCGVPVIASRIGVSGEIVTDGVTGLLFNPGDEADLAAKVRWAWDHPAEMAQIGLNARREYEEKYTADRNYEMLMSIYNRAISERHAAR
jgi:glycosyltransferase involved in cell wall biosynthesis